MPHSRTTLPADRFFARIDKFECECPNCGQIISTAADQRKLPARLRTTGLRRGVARQRPRSAGVWSLTWNPLSQRLKCPSCATSYIAGLMLYPVLKGRRRFLEPPPDAMPTRRQLVELRRMTGGWWMKESYANGQEVNLVVDSECCCPKGGWAPACPIHGDPAYQQRRSESASVAEPA